MAISPFRSPFPVFMMKQQIKEYEFQEICPTTNYWVEEKDKYIKNVCKTRRCGSCIQRMDFINQKLQKGSKEWKEIVKNYEERCKKYPPHGVRGQCKWTCPECGDRCGGVEDHSGPHQCPKHYKPKTKFFICKECYLGGGNGTSKMKYLTKEALLADHPTLKDYPELIGEIEE